MASSDQIVFVDWDGTLSKARFWSHVDGALYEQIQRQLFIENKALVDKWMTGEKTSENVCAWLAEKTNSISTELFSALIETCESMSVTKEAVEAIGELKKCATVVLVTDNMDCFSRFTIKKAGLQGLFDEIINSSDRGRMKRDNNGSVFTGIAEKYGVPINLCHLIDDSESTCRLFNGLGGQAYQTSSVDMTTELLSHLSLNIGR